MTVTAHPPAVGSPAEAATAVAALLPSAVPLAAGPQQPAAILGAASFAGAVVSDLGGGASVGVLVQTVLVEALAGSPLGELDLAAAVQPALDAAAASLGGRAAPARTVPVDDVLDLVGPGAQAVPLLDGTTIHAAVVVGAPAPVVTAVPMPTAAPTAVAGPGLASPGIELLHGVEMQVTVEIGRTRVSVRELLSLAPGDVLELDREAGSPADLLVNGRLVARGEIVVVDENFALRVTEILPVAG